MFTVHGDREYERDLLGLSDRLRGDGDLDRFLGDGDLEVLPTGDTDRRALLERDRLQWT